MTEPFLSEGQRSKLWYQNHREEKKAYAKRYRLAHKGFIAVQKAKDRQRVKETVFSHYADGKPICRGCGQKNLDRLVLDHINSDGIEHGKIHGYTYGLQMWLWAKRNNYPTIFQVLCYKCNRAKAKARWYIRKEELEDWLERLDQRRAGSIFDDHTELGMKYVLRKLLGKSVVDLEQQALEWQRFFLKHLEKNIT